MSIFRGAWITVLSDAVAAGRSTLRELDGREVPPSLRRVAAYTGGKLPPPLAASLLAEIERNEWLREKILEDWEGDPDSPAGLFLRRPDGWWMEVAGAVADSASGRDEAQVAELQKQVARLDSKLQTAAGKIEDQRRAIDSEKRVAKESIESVRASIEAKYQQEVGEVAQVRAEAADLTDRLTRLESEHRDLQDAFASLRARFAKARRMRSADAGGPDETGRSGASMPSNPVQLARLLDLQTASFGRTPQAQQAGRREEPQSRLSLKAGIRPDSADAIRWLIELPDPVVVLVDGYNAQFHIDRSDFTSGAARRKLVDALRRLREAGSAKHRVVVVFDSTLPGDRIPRSSLGAIEVRFTERETIADEEIVEMAGDLDRVVVISSDREVREGAEANNAVVLWSEALAEWLERP